jgi:uncharacterized protein YjbI with pentapeptide repeats
MLQTPKPPAKNRSLLSKAFASDSFGGRVRNASPYPYIPAKFSGMPNFMHYSIGPGADLQGADLSEADLRWSNFRRASLRGAKLRGSILWGSILTNADLTDADLSHADLTGVDLVGADMTGCRLDGTCFLGARYSKTTKFPKKFGDPEKKGMVSLQESMQIN